MFWFSVGMTEPVMIVIVAAHGNKHIIGAEVYIAGKTKGFLVDQEITYDQFIKCCTRHLILILLNLSWR